MPGKVVLYKHPGAPDPGAGDAAGAGGLAQRLGMHVQERRRLLKVEGLHGDTAGAGRAAGNRKPQRPVASRR